jgi:carbohydrate phosphorylase
VPTEEPSARDGGASRAAAFAALARNNRVRAGADPESIACAIVDSLFYRQGRLPEFATATEWYNAVARTVRDHVVDHFVETARILTVRDSKIVCYLSAEFLVGPQLMQNLINLQMLDKFQRAVALLGLDFDEIVAQEEEPGLGNGGLGRLAACFLESMSTLEIPAIGYGRRKNRRTTARRVPARLQRHECAADLSGGRSLGADFTGRHRGVGNRQHEVRDERSADDRDPRRRKHRNPRRRRHRELLRIRPDGRTGTRGEDVRLFARRGIRAASAVARDSGSSEVGTLFRGRRLAVRAHHRRDRQPGRISAAGRLRRVCRVPGSCRRRFLGRRGLDPGVDSHGWAGSRRTGRFANTAATSGTSSRWRR